jgi:hypothetical protein
VAVPANALPVQISSAQLVSAIYELIRLYRWWSYKNNPAVFHREYEHQIDAISDHEVELLALMEKVRNVKPSIWYDPIARYGDRDRIGRVRFAFRRLKNMSRENGFSVLMVIVPWLSGDAEAYPYGTAHHIVELEAHGAGFDTINPTKEFMDVGVENLQIGPRDLVRPNKTGHAIIADALSTYVRSRLNILPLHAR